MKDLLKKLEPEEIFLMNIHNKFILAILDISICESIINNNFEILSNGIYTYSRLGNLNRIHLPGFNLCNCIESFILDDKILLKNCFKGIDVENNWKKTILQEYKNFGPPNGKFDLELLQIFQKMTSLENGIEDNYNNLVKLYSKCQWTRTWYRECVLINYLPIFLVGIYKLIGKKFKIETNNEYIMKYVEYLDTNNKENKLVYNFTGGINFLNKILDKEYEKYCNVYKNKCHCT
jgi:hypothetical protein